VAPIASCWKPAEFFGLFPLRYSKVSNNILCSITAPVYIYYIRQSILWHFLGSLCMV
jgi:hypothetical protein